MNLVAFIIPAGKMNLPQGLYQEEGGGESGEGQKLTVAEQP